MSTHACPKLDGINVMAFLMPKERVRFLKPGETIPSHMDAGFELLGKLDRDWIWILEYQSQIRGVLVASNFHGIAFLWRLKVLPGVSQTGVLRLLKRFRSDCLKRGVNGYMTLTDVSTATGKQLKSIVERCGGKDHGTVNILSAPLPRERI